ncbi:MAG TPA: type II secretion system protein [Phycisphaerales bacterium]|nr:type II secretion system protein [Phycisphaerales bacterium]
METNRGRCPAGVRRAFPGFTLIEILVVVAVIAMLIAILLPGLSRSREAARASVCLSRLHNLHVAMRVYADEYRTFPVADQDDVLKDLEMPENVWHCPADRVRKAAAPGNVPYSSYTYLAPIYMDPPGYPYALVQLKPHVALRKYENNPNLPLFWNFEGWHDQARNVVYWNGSARRKDW